MSLNNTTTPRKQPKKPESLSFASAALIPHDSPPESPIPKPKSKNKLQKLAKRTWTLLKKSSKHKPKTPETTNPISSDVPIPNTSKDNFQIDMSFDEAQNLFPPKLPPHITPSPNKKSVNNPSSNVISLEKPSSNQVSTKELSPNQISSNRPPLNRVPTNELSPNSSTHHSFNPYAPLESQTKPNNTTPRKNYAKSISSFTQKLNPFQRKQSISINNSPNQMNTTRNKRSSSSSSLMNKIAISQTISNIKTVQDLRDVLSKNSPRKDVPTRPLPKRPTTSHDQQRTKLYSRESDKPYVRLGYILSEKDAMKPLSHIPLNTNNSNRKSFSQTNNTINIPNKRHSLYSANNNDLRSELFRATSLKDTSNQETVNIDTRKTFQNNNSNAIPTTSNDEINNSPSLDSTSVSKPKIVPPPSTVEDPIPSPQVPGQILSPSADDYSHSNTNSSIHTLDLEISGPSSEDRITLKNQIDNHTPHSSILNPNTKSNSDPNDSSYEIPQSLKESENEPHLQTNSTISTNEMDNDLSIIVEPPTKVDTEIESNETPLPESPNNNAISKLIDNESTTQQNPIVDENILTVNSDDCFDNEEPVAAENTIISNNSNTNISEPDLVSTVIKSASPDLQTTLESRDINEKPFETPLDTYIIEAPFTEVKENAGSQESTNNKVPISDESVYTPLHGSISSEYYTSITDSNPSISKVNSTLPSVSTSNEIESPKDSGFDVKESTKPNISEKKKLIDDLSVAIGNFESAFRGIKIGSLVPQSSNSTNGALFPYEHDSDQIPPSINKTSVLSNTRDEKVRDSYGHRNNDDICYSEIDSILVLSDQASLYGMNDNLVEGKYGSVSSTRPQYYSHNRHRSSPGLSSVNMKFNENNPNFSIENQIHDVLNTTNNEYDSFGPNPYPLQRADLVHNQIDPNNPKYILERSITNMDFYSPIPDNILVKPQISLNENNLNNMAIANVHKPQLIPNIRPPLNVFEKILNRKLDYPKSLLAPPLIGVGFSIFKRR
ncbi:hypothetical protein BB558_001704 [Smittium angustum]|uniref:Uncharacterized protein n=1 Tax=Smittium angustum TaxID=133377 RepID=A0A2U1JAP8_SMIAN|nr:hypothetical protein BB558_001704 [Smittium angustum]